MNTNPYLEATRLIPAGETRTFRELAALAGKPAAARAAGRAIGACPKSERQPWQRVVSADGSMSREPDRARLQLERLRREVARPRAGESIARWAARRKVACIGNWKTRTFAAATDPRVETWPADRVEALASSARALERGFTPMDTRSSHTANTRPLRRPARPNHEPGEKPLRGARARPSLALEPPAVDVADRLQRVDWSTAQDELGSRGAFTIETFLDARRCRALRDLFELPDLFERTIDMAPRAYGVGTYRYFKEPLPEPAFTLRDAIYRHLLDLARRARRVPEYPPSLAEFHEQCRAAGQRRGSSILLSYPTGGVNHPHRDIYGPLWFPYQAVLVLSAREEDFEGGELLLHTRTGDGAEERRALPLDQGDLCLFASRGFEAAAIDAPDDGSAARFAQKGSRKGTRKSARDAASRKAATPGTRWVEQTHGLSSVTRGRRFALGIVLHLAQ